MFLLFDVWEVNRVKSYSSSWQMNMEWAFLQMRHDTLQQFCLGLLFQRGLVSTRGEYSHLENEKNHQKTSLIKMHGSEGSITEEKGYIHLDYWNKIELEIAHNAVHLDFLRYFERDLLETVVLSSAISQRFFFCCSWKLTLPLTHLVIRLKPWRDKESWGFTAERTGGRRVRRTIWVKIIENQGLRKSFAQYN